jgi:hypothetical protein
MYRRREKERKSIPEETNDEDITTNDDESHALRLVRSDSGSKAASI